MPVRIGTSSPVSSPMIGWYAAPPGRVTTGRSAWRMTVNASGMGPPWPILRNDAITVRPPRSLERARSMDLIVRNARIADHPRGGLFDIGVEKGLIVAIEPRLAAEGPSYDADGRLVCGGFVETHIHLDKSCIIDRCAPETEREPHVVQRVAAVKRDFTVADVRARARR